MKRLLSILAPLAVALVTLVPAAHAGDKDPLFVNLTTDDPHAMARRTGERIVAHLERLLKVNESGLFPSV